MPVLNFTVQYDDLMNDIDDNSGDISTIGGVGRVYFEPVFLPGSRIAATLYNPRPSGFQFRTFEGYLDADGRLKDKAGGTPGVRLWARDPVFDELTRLQYRVWAELTDPLGREVPFSSFHFDAPDTDMVVNLAAEIPQPGQKYGRGRPGFGIGSVAVNDDANLVITREDGTVLAPVAIPESHSLPVAYALTFGR